MPTKALRFIPLIAWCTLIFIFSSLPATSVSEQRTVDVGLHKLAHIIEYTILYCCCYHAQVLKPQKRVMQLVLPLLFVVLYGLCDEVHQAFVPTRSPKISDVAVDSVGGVVGYIIVKLIHKKGPNV